MGFGCSKINDEPKNLSPNKSSLNTTTSVNSNSGVNKQYNSRHQQQQQQITPQHQQVENNNVSKTNGISNPDSRKRHKADESDEDNLEDLDLDAGWYGTNKNTTKVKPSDRQTREMNEYNSQKSVETNKQHTEYPETYAERNIRGIYRQNNLLRQKTIYRDPEEWQDVNEEVKI